MAGKSGPCTAMPPPPAAPPATPDCNGCKATPCNVPTLSLPPCKRAGNAHRALPSILPATGSWQQLVLPMIDNSIAAARATGARILLPGTIYNYGPDALPELTESSPQHPVTRKGAVRVELEQRLRTAADDGVRSLIVRAGDFFGPHAGNNWLSQGLVKPGREVTAITYPGKPGLGHQWAYLPDVAETMLQLVNRPEALATFDTFHMQGHWDQDGARMTEAIRTALAKPALPVRAFPWWLVPLAAPLVPFFSRAQGNALSVAASNPHGQQQTAQRARQ